MTIVFMILAVLLLGAVGNSARLNIRDIKATGVPRKQLKNYSWPAQELLKQYRALPEDMRPPANVPAIVKALDVKHGVAEANEHYSRNNRNDYGSFSATQTWDNCVNNYSRGHGGAGGNTNCKLPKYYELHSAMNRIQDSIDKQRRAQEIAAVGGELENVDGFLQSLTETRDSIDRATKELT